MVAIGLTGFILQPAAQDSTAKSPAKKQIYFTPGQKKPRLFGIAFTLTDFNAPKNFGSNSNASTTAIKNLSAGVSVGYWSPLTPMIDFSGKINAVFHDFSAIYKGTPGKTEVGIEVEPSVIIRAVKDENLLSPFVSAGLGFGLYTDRAGAYLPLGMGLQLNASSHTYLFVQMQYKVSLTPKVLGDNFFYSIGFAQNIHGD
ncbi:MAG TPA: hypothetical protein PKC39_11320 [Ferruginibacter sp.]|nr:hypothetical protein [Ferruginibacter sp.]